MSVKTFINETNVASGGSGTIDYNTVNNKPQLNNVELVGNKELKEIAPYLISDLTYDSSTHTISAYNISSQVNLEFPWQRHLTYGEGLEENVIDNFNEELNVKMDYETIETNTDNEIQVKLDTNGGLKKSSQGVGVDTLEITITALNIQAHTFSADKTYTDIADALSKKKQIICKHNISGSDWLYFNLSQTQSSTYQFTCFYAHSQGLILIKLEFQSSGSNVAEGWTVTVTPVQ